MSRIDRPGSQSNASLSRMAIPVSPPSARWLARLKALMPKPMMAAPTRIPRRFLHRSDRMATDSFSARLGEPAGQLLVAGAQLRCESALTRR